MNRSAFVVAFVVGCSLLACGEKAPANTPSPSPAASASPATFKAPGTATVGDKTTCLVSNEEFTVVAGSPKVDYKGKTYYFCCPGCDSKFKADPEKYLNKSGT